MECSISVTEKQINEIFLYLKPLTDRDAELYRDNNALVLKEEDLKEINSHLKASDNLGECVFEVIERAIEKSSVNVYKYPLPSKLRIVRDNNSDNS